jgi:uncharacterized protein YndB with AHSA1/START domain
MRFFILILAAASLRADVTDSAPSGFTIKSTWMIKASPDEVYKRLMNNVGDWWNPQHTWSRDAHNLSIEPKINGCFCEKLPNNGGVRHLEIVYLDPGKTVRFSGGLGPFQSMAVTGVLTIQLTPGDGITRLSLVYTVGGYFEKGLDTIAPSADLMLKEQFTRLQSYVETGSPAPAKK